MRNHGELEDGRKVLKTGTHSDFPKVAQVG